MKLSKKIKGFLILLVLVAIFNNSKGQVPIIYAIDEINNDSSSVGIYNYETQDYEELFILSPRARFDVYKFTFDPYRKIIYYLRSTSGCSGPTHHEVYAISIINQVRTLQYEIVDKISAIDFQYDFFSNSLMIRGWDSIRFFSVAENIILSKLEIPTSDSVRFMPPPNSYNINTREYLYYHRFIDSPDYFRAFVNVDSNNFTCASNTMQEWPSRLTPDLSTNSFYGVTKIKNDSSHVIRIDPKTGLFTKLHLMPSIWAYAGDHRLFDPYNLKYILSCAESTYEYFFSIYDVTADSIYTTPNRFFHSTLFMDYSPSPQLKYINDTLVASVSDIYYWYCNDTLFNDATTRYHKPLKTGYYKFSTLNYLNDTLFSNEIYIESPNAINTETFETELSLFPNPIKSFLNIKINKSTSKFNKISITDIKGRLIYNGIYENYRLYQIDFSLIPNGIYIVKCESDSDAFSKIVIKNNE